MISRDGIERSQDGQRKSSIARVLLSCVCMYFHHLCGLFIENSKLTQSATNMLVFAESVQLSGKLSFRISGSRLALQHTTVPIFEPSHFLCVYLSFETELSGSY